MKRQKNRKCSRIAKINYSEGMSNICLIGVSEREERKNEAEAIFE